MAEATGLDPRLFRPEAIDPEVAAFNEKLEAMLATLPPTQSQEPAAIRAARESGGGAFGPLVLSEMAVNRSISGPGGDLVLRTFIPDNPKGVYLHIHGGGWVLGRAHHSDVSNERIAKTCNVAVVSVDYRLAPEDPHPAGQDDAEAAALWLLQNAKAEFGTETLLIGGESAGAHLTATTLLRLRDRNGTMGFRAANFLYGVFDLSMTPSQVRWGERNLILSTPLMAWFYNHYVPAQDRRDPSISPLYADLRGMPPALFSVGTLDPLLDDSLFMHARWAAAGNESELVVYPGGIHGFNSLPTPIGKQANDRVAEFLSQYV